MKFLTSFGMCVLIIVSKAEVFLVFSQRTCIIWYMVISHEKKQFIKCLGCKDIIPAEALWNSVPVLRRWREERLGHRIHTSQVLSNPTSVLTTTTTILIVQWWSFNEWVVFIETVETALNKPCRKVENLDLILQLTARDLMLSKKIKGYLSRFLNYDLVCFLCIDIDLKIMLVNFALLFACSLLENLITILSGPLAYKTGTGWNY